MPDTVPHPAGHDSLARRLADILIKAHAGETLVPERLADEFNVHVRTIQRDLHERLRFLSLIRKGHGYRVAPADLGKLQWSDLDRLAAAWGVEDLFPHPLRDLLPAVRIDDSRPAWRVQPPSREDLSPYRDRFACLEQAILQCRMVSFRMSSGRSAVKTFDDVAPYRLLNMKGIWYLAAVHQDRLKTFGIGKLEAPLQSDTVFCKDPQVEHTIDQLDGIWHSDRPCEVVLAVDAVAAVYFRRRTLVPRQQITREHPDGSVEITATAGHPQQILPVVRYWIPHVRILQPVAWQRDLERSLTDYLAARGADGS